jgi:D-alanyl-D-alanine carboxypeptidase
VSALSGYVRSTAGETIVFSMLVNGARRSVASAHEAEEDFVDLLARAPRRREAAVAPPRGIPR